MNILGKTKALTNQSIPMVCLGLGLSFFSSYANAAFEVIDEPSYGNAQNETFRRAIDNTEPLDSSDRTFLSRVDQKRVGQRSYWKAQIARPTTKLKMVTNETTGVPGQPATRNTNEDTFHVALGLGYKWIRWAVELEFLISETFDYRTNPALVNPVFVPPGVGATAIQLKGVVKPWAFFGNIEYEVPTFFDFVPTSFHPYVNLGIGTAVKTTDSQTSTLGGAARQIKSSRSNDFAWHFGLGLKYQVTGNLLLDFAYRWMALGDVKFGQIEGLTLKARDLDTNGFYLGLTYQV